MVLLERGLVSSQASGVNYRCMRQQGWHPAERPFARRSRKIWSCMAALIGTDAKFDPSGHLTVARSEAEEAEWLSWNARADSVLLLLRQLRERRGLSFLLVGHDLALVCWFWGRVAVMCLGRIIEEGPAARVLEAPLRPLRTNAARCLAHS